MIATAGAARPNGSGDRGRLREIADDFSSAEKQFLALRVGAP
jgi:hypothetical protein